MNFISDYKIDSCKTLWETMDLKTKLKWYKFNKLYSYKGELLRKIIELNYNVDVLLWEKENPEKDFIEECPHKLEYPNYLEPNPKIKIIMNFTIKPLFPVNYIEINLNLEK